MKKIILLPVGLFLLLIFIMSITGCKKDPLPEPTPSADSTNVTVFTFNGETITNNTATCTVQTGNSVSMNWASNADEVLVLINEDTVHKKGTDNFYSLPLTVNTTFKLVFIKGEFKSEKIIDVIVSSDTTPPEITSFYADPSSIEYMGITTLHWSSSRATWCKMITNGKPAIVVPNGYLTIDTLTVNTVFEFIVGNAFGSDTSTLLVSVAPATNENYYCDFGPWKLAKGEHAINLSGPWVRDSIIPGSDADLGLENFFHGGNFTFTVNGQLHANGRWNEILPDSVNICGGHSYVDKLNSDSMVRTYIVNYITGPVIMRTHYYHP